MDIKFYYNGLKIDGKKLISCGYHKGGYGKYPSETICIYSGSYGHSLPVIDSAIPVNETDTQTDYYEKDRLFITPENKFYKEVNAALEKSIEHNAKLMERRSKKHRRMCKGVYRAS